MGVTSWSEEEDDFLRRSAKSGLSATETAKLLADFGMERSRSALIGRAFRLGFGFSAQVTAPKAVAPKPPKAEEKIRVANIRRKAAQRQVEAARGQPEEAAAELAALDTAFSAAARDNPGVLFLLRDMAKQCARPMPGWDAAPISEKRVCGLPVLTKRVSIAGVFVALPTSWCAGCTPDMNQAAHRQLDQKYLSRIDRSVRAA